MTSDQTRMPVLDVLPMAYWVDGDLDYRETSEQSWDNVFIHAAELNVIVPISKNVLSDSTFDIVGEVEPRVIEAVANRVDSACIFGINRPRAWRNDIVTAARQAGNNVAFSNGDMYDLLLAENGVWSKVEECGYDVNGAVAAPGTKASLRSIKDNSNRPIFVTDMQGKTPYAIDGVPVTFAKNGSFDKNVAKLVVGDFSQAVYSIRQDVDFEILDEGVIQNPATKEIVYNLAQQRLLALMVTFRMGWALPNPATRLNSDRTGCPFAYLEPAAAVVTSAATFNVTDGESAVSGARIDLNGSILTTDSTGAAVFNLRDGSYPYKVKANGFKTQSGEINISGGAVTTAITLVKNG